jgi:hypothetical protein
MTKFNMPFKPVNIQSLTLFDSTDNDFSSYYYQYNSTELVWAQAKGYVGEWNGTFRTAIMEELIHEAIFSIFIYIRAGDMKDF